MTRISDGTLIDRLDAHVSGRLPVVLVPYAADDPDVLLVSAGLARKEPRKGRGRDGNHLHSKPTPMHPAWRRRLSDLYVAIA